MKSDYMKAVLSANFRFSKQHKFIATECGRFSSDFLAYKAPHLTEVEIKVSKSDLNADFKKDKHRIYEMGNNKWAPHYFYFAVPEELKEYAVAKCVGKKYGVMVIADTDTIKVRDIWIGNTKDFAERRIDEMKRKLGGFKVLHFYEKIDEDNNRSSWWLKHEYQSFHAPYKDRVRIVKRATKMHNNLVDRRVIHSIVARLSSEMSNLRIDQQILEKKNGTTA